MLTLAAFADEISPDLDEQIRVLRDLRIHHLELRGVAGQNVLDLGPGLRREIRTKLADAGLRVAGIGSPVGKVRLDEPWPVDYDRFKVGVELAELFGAPLIRIFSYYPPAGTTLTHSIARHRDAVLQRLQRQVDYLLGTSLVLVLENEFEIHGQGGPANRDYLQTINSPRLRMAFDPGNFGYAGDDAWTNWALLKSYTAHFHIKDIVRGAKEYVPSGQGEMRIGEILKEAYDGGYRGCVTLEPHLAAAGQFAGFTSPKLFALATQALRDVARQHGVPLT